MLDDKNKLTHIENLGEFGLIHKLTNDIKIYNPSTIKGVGDDAAVLEYKKDKQILVSTDLLVEHIHFDLTYTPLKHLGYKAAVVNFSDIYAMNGTPKQITVSMAVSSKYTVEALEEIYEGIKLACEVYQVDLVGGDTTSNVSGLLIAITVIGEVEKGKAVGRNTAKESDLIYATGDFGAAYMGLLLLEREKAVYQQDNNMKPDLEGFDYVLQRQLKPEARKDVIKILKENDILPTSMIDVSDGLASELLHICTNSNTGCHVYEEKIPIDVMTASTAESFNILPVVAALNGGEDYELLFTIKQADYEKIKNLNIAAPIGYITDKASGVQLVGASGEQVPLKAQGWDAFKK